MNALLSERENRIAALGHPLGLLEFVAQSERFKSDRGAPEVLPSVNQRGAVNLTGIVSDAETEPVSTAGAIGFIEKGGEYFAIVGERVFSLDDLRLHGILSGCDVAEFKYSLKYLTKAVQA